MSSCCVQLPNMAYSREAGLGKLKLSLPSGMAGKEAYGVHLAWL